MKNLVAILIVLTLMGCKTEPKPIKEEPVVETKKEFIINMNFRVNKADEFRFMVNNIVYDEFQKKNIQILEKVVPSNDTESLSANFGEQISQTIILNFGGKEQKEVMIESMTITYGEEVLLIDAINLKDYFTFNKFITQDENSGTLITQKIDGKHSPAIILRPAVIKKLREEQ